MTNQTQPASLPINTTTSPTGTQSTGSSYTFDQVENYWIQAGGNPQSAAMAASVADAESGLNAGASRVNPDGTTGVGLWLIPQNGTPPGSNDPLASARAAVQLSQNGTDWTQWCTSWSDNNCGQSGGTYLGSGANALMSLGTQAQSYQTFGSTPAGSGVGASSATTGLGSLANPSGSSKTVYVVLIIVAIVVFLVMRNQKKGQPDGGPGRDLPQLEEDQSTGSIHVPAHTRPAPKR